MRFYLPPAMYADEKYGVVQRDFAGFLRFIAGGLQSLLRSTSHIDLQRSVRPLTGGAGAHPCEEIAAGMVLPGLQQAQQGCALCRLHE